MRTQSTNRNRDKELKAIGQIVLTNCEIFVNINCQLPLHFFNMEFITPERLHIPYPDVIQGVNII